MKKVIRVVLDTNVLISALWSENGTPAQVVKLISDKTIIPYFSENIFNEYVNVLSRPKFLFSPYKKDMLLAKIREYGEIISSGKSGAPLPDESDRIFYDTAKTSGAILITGNLKHFPNDPFIMSPAQFLTDLKENRLADE